MATESPTSRPRLVLIDGYSLLFRAYLTPGPFFATSDGRPTGAVRGFANMLLTLLEQERPEAIAVAWDAPGPTFRDALFPEYKAHRPEIAEDLRAQFRGARDLVSAFGIPSAEAPGYEADDLIGALSVSGSAAGYDVVIVTGDSDQLQLVRDGVIVRMTRTGVTEMDAFDAARVREKYGVPPERMADYKALVGDTSDNIPGVPGVGKVTAVRLLGQYGSLEEVLSQAESLPERTATDRKVRQALIDRADQARLSLRLATIDTQAPCGQVVQPYTPTAETWARVRALFDDLEFRTLASRLPEPAVTVAVTECPISVETIDSRNALDTALLALRRADLAAIGLHTDQQPARKSDVLAIGLAVRPGHAWQAATAPSAAPTAHLFSEPVERVFGVSPTVVVDALAGERRWCAWDAKRALLAMDRHGCALPPPTFDGQVACYLLQPGRSEYAIDRAVLEHAPEYAGSVRGAGGAEAAAHEAAVMLALAPRLAARLEAEGLADVFSRIEMPLVPILAAMEREGVPVDTGRLASISAELEHGVALAAARIYELAGEEFLIGSTQQLQQVLFEKLGLPTGQKTKTGYSTRANLLESLAGEYEIAARILEYRELTKLKSTYADALPRLVDPETGRIHTSLHQTGTATGRLSSSDPNLQNIPVRSEAGRRIRSAFVAPRGHVLLACDYSQIELRVFAHCTQDPEMLAAFHRGEDIHTATAVRLFGVPAGEVTREMRSRAKTVNFAVIYGQSDFGLAASLGISRDEARAFKRGYFEQFPGVQEYTRSTIEGARRTGFVQTPLGRRRYVPDVRSSNRTVREAAERAAVNMPIQGAAADIMKLAMIAVDRRLSAERAPWRMLLQVHDDLLIAVPEGSEAEAARVIGQCMEGAYELSVPLRVDATAGANWADMSPIR
ncbi:MAG TPA: DNA polymerase I [Chthonomonadales bacterium]|nr:DNA polymerase I [Chthonomonadales bacterium]